MNLDLLKKLTRLANNNPNENEANLAARKVCKMLEEGKWALSPTPEPQRGGFRPAYGNPYDFDFAEMFRQARERDAQYARERAERYQKQREEEIKREQERREERNRRMRQEQEDRKKRNPPPPPPGHKNWEKEWFNGRAEPKPKKEKSEPFDPYHINWEPIFSPTPEQERYYENFREGRWDNPFVDDQPKKSAANATNKPKELKKCVKCGKEKLTANINNIYVCNECQWGAYESERTEQKDKI